jgi:hypothetical protein
MGRDEGAAMAVGSLLLVGTVLSATKSDFGRVVVDCEVVLERC